PVREALRRLSAEGYVVFQPNRGAEIVAWSRADIEEIYELRAQFESFAASRAAVRSLDVAHLKQLAAEMERWILAPDGSRLPHEDVTTERWKEIAALNSDFHRTIVRAAGGERLLSMIRALVQAPLMLQTYKHYSIEGIARSFGHHRELIDAFEAKDPAWAGSVMRAHVFHAKSVLLTVWETTSPDD
ncbi:MAG TPA: GntR family transcriptional regulator, partial [Pseudonocardia sp.]|nr:GntR family transcriptional regulator [Pseudonocardia sp.]